MSSDDVKFIEDLTAWVGPEGETRDARMALLAADGVVVALNTLKSILAGRYNASRRLQVGIRARMSMLDQESLVSPQAARAASSG